MESLSKPIIIGVDEAGRGPLFGRVYTSAVILNNKVDKTKLKDSKRFTSFKKIQEVYHHICENTEFYSIDFAEHDEIDKFNILQATQRSMHRSIRTIIDKLISSKHTIDTYESVDNILKSILILVDGNYFNSFKYFYNDQFYIIKHNTLVKGDDLCKEISASSILAKVSRDTYIVDIVNKYPEYNERYDFLKNKGYGTKKHREGIKQYGYTPFHRKSFKLKT